MSLLWAAVFVLLFPVIITALTYLFVAPIGWYYGDLDEMNVDRDTFVEMVLFGYAHFIARWLMMAGRHKIAARIYSIAGHHYYKRNNGHWCVSPSLPDNDVEVVLA